MLLKDRKEFEKAEIQDKWGQTMWQLIHSYILTPEAILYEVQPADTLAKIAKNHGTTVELIKQRNKTLGSTIKPGDSLSIWVKPFVLRVIKKTNQLQVLLDGKIIKTYLVSTGKSETTTPLGEFEIKYRYPDPVWFHHGEIVPAGSPKNFLGTRWLGFNIPKYGIHGTIYPELIGQSVSGGCIRMKNEDVEELYDVIPIGTKVIVE